MKPRHVVSLCTAAILACSAVACGVTPQEHPRPLDGSTTTVPSASTGTSASPGRPTSTPSGRTVIYLLRAGRLLAVDRSGQDIQTALNALLTGPTAAELADGVRTAVPRPAKTVTAKIDGSVAWLHLPPEFTKLDGAQQALAVAQLVYTTTEQVPALTGVRLLQGGRELRAPTVTGELVSRPVTRDDYASIAPIGHYRPPSS